MRSASNLGKLSLEVDTYMDWNASNLFPIESKENQYVFEEMENYSFIERVSNPSEGP